MGIDSLRIDQLKIVSFPNWMEIVVRHIIILCLQCQERNLTVNRATHRRVLHRCPCCCVLGGPVY